VVFAHHGGGEEVGSSERKGREDKGREYRGEAQFVNVRSPYSAALFRRTEGGADKGRGSERLGGGWGQNL